MDHSSISIYLDNLGKKCSLKFLNCFEALKKLENLENFNLQWFIPCFRQLSKKQVLKIGGQFYEETTIIIQTKSKF